MKEVKFQLTDLDPNITEDGVFGAAKWCDTWSFQCPENMGILLKPGDYFSMKMYDTGDAEMAAPDAQVKLEVRDPSGQVVGVVFPPENYLSVKEFQQYSKMAQLWIEQPILVTPRSKIVVMTKDDLGTDASGIVLSYARLITTKVLGTFAKGQSPSLPSIEPFVIMQEDSDVTQTSSTAGSLTDLFVYRVPKGRAIILRPSDVFACYLYNTSSAVATNTCPVKLEVRDATGLEKKPILGPLQYGSFQGEFQDKDKLVHLDINGELTVVEQEYIALMVNNAVAINCATSYMSLRCHIRR